MIKHFLSSIFIILLSGCSYHIKYDMSLGSVEKQSGDVIKTVEIINQDMVFEDDIIKIKWLVTPDDIYFKVKNKSDSTMKIDWNGASLVCIDKISHKVVHKGVKLSKRNESQQYTVVPRGTILHDTISAVESYYFNSRRGWTKTNKHQAFLLPGIQKVQYYKQTKELLKKIPGKSVEILLPIQSDGKETEYIFSFIINDYEYKASNAYINSRLDAFLHTPL